MHFVWCILILNISFSFHWEPEGAKQNKDDPAVLFLALSKRVFLSWNLLSTIDGYKALDLTGDPVCNFKIAFCSFSHSTPSSPSAVYQQGKFPINKLTVRIYFVPRVNLLLITIPLKCIDFSQSAKSNAKDYLVLWRHMWCRCIKTLTSTFPKQCAQFSETGWVTRGDTGQTVHRTWWPSWTYHRQTTESSR